MAHNKKEFFNGLDEEEYFRQLDEKRRWEENDNIKRIQMAGQEHLHPDKFDKNGKPIKSIWLPIFKDKNR